MSDGPVCGADFASHPPCFLFEDAEGEAGTGLTVAEILPNPALKPAATFTLRDVNELMQEQLPVAPAIAANDDPMANGDAAGSVGDDEAAPGGFGQFCIIRERNAIDDQHFNPVSISNADPPRIGEVGFPQGRAAGEDEFLLGLGPLISERQKLFECFWIDHVGGGG